MSKIKVIKRATSGIAQPLAAKRPAKKKKSRTVENTIQGWIEERRENNDEERRTSVDAWNTDTSPSEAV